MRFVLGYLSAVCLLVLLVCEAVVIPTFFIPFYDYEYGKRAIPQQILVEKDELMNVTGELLSYMRGGRGDLNVPSVVNGESREFFNQREKEHMADVRLLFDRLFMVRNITFWVFLLFIIVMAFLRYGILITLARCAREIVAGFCILAAFLAAVIALDFNRAFTVFHLLFFDNDLWILDPATDLLVNIVPQGFFIDIAVFVAALFIVTSALIIIFSTLYINKASGKRRYPA